MNGPAGVGKTTIAERLHKEMPMAFLVDIEAQRKFINDYQEYPKESMDAAFSVSMAIVGEYLKTGNDVIVEQMIWNINDYLDRLVKLGKESGAEVYEFILNASKETVMDRISKRNKRPDPEKVSAFWEETQKLKHERPDAIFIDTEELNTDEVFEKIKNRILC